MRLQRRGLPSLALGAGLAIAGMATMPALADPVPTRLTLEAPDRVESGRVFVISAQLTTQDGEPIAGVPVQFVLDGAVGSIALRSVTTNAVGKAALPYRELRAPSLPVKAVFAGNDRFDASEARVRVAIAGVEQGMAMSTSPGPLAKGVVFALLAGVWLTYGYAISLAIRISWGRRPVTQKVEEVRAGLEEAVVGSGKASGGI